MKSSRDIQLMTLPCENGQDARSRVAATMEEGQRIALTGEIRNVNGEFWYETRYMEQQCFVYGGHLEALEKEYWFSSFWKRIFG